MRVLVVLLVGWLAVGCATRIEPRPALPGPGGFSHAELDRVQRRFVDAEGRVDYPGLAADRAGLDAYYRRLAGVSPRSHPALFPTRADELAYWINAYNAAVLVAVLEAWPIESVRDVKPPLPVLPRLAGFFYFLQVRLGDERMNLYDLENEIIRAYGEPRIHFAINCASIGCPQLPREAFHPARLEAQLEREARRFFANPGKLRIDDEARRVWLSSILDWFDGDFLSWYASSHPGGDPDLLDYVRLYVPPPVQKQLDAARDYELTFIEYDWGVNAQTP